MIAAAFVAVLVLVAVVATAFSQCSNETSSPLESDNLPELEQLKPKGEGWSEGEASAYNRETNDGWDATASGIPLDDDTPTVAVPQENRDLLGATVEIFYAGKTVTAKVTDTGALGPLGRMLDLSPAVWRAFGASSLSDWGVRTVYYRFV